MPWALRAAATLSAATTMLLVAKKREAIAIGKEEKIGSKLFVWSIGEKRGSRGEEFGERGWCKPLVGIVLPHHGPRLKVYSIGCLHLGARKVEGRLDGG